MPPGCSIQASSVFVLVPVVLFYFLRDWNKLDERGLSRARGLREVSEVAGLALAPVGQNGIGDMQPVAGSDAALNREFLVWHPLSLRGSRHICGRS